ncbi:hypothetical protein GCK72_006797 [Caenorhabditis remanei]|uniref:Uncharacterized protein n=1 Tax=Caenorhabditis remanei TaxID=31234 RepID=A0A6A5HHJ8_CAERE|nr:hypothetical protein GCK72_006797 [Caenorhabditis remanei]KAF1766839.1 hypothetical protein GCK72_006797 [Caenorhabditis remanei]
MVFAVSKMADVSLGDYVSSWTTNLNRNDAGFMVDQEVFDFCKTVLVGSIRWHERIEKRHILVPQGKEDQVGLSLNCFHMILPVDGRSRETDEGGEKKKENSW